MILKIALIFILSWRKIIVSALQKLEELSTNEEMPDTLKMTMDGQDGEEPIEAHCEAVSKDDGSVQYECRFIHPNQEIKMNKKAVPRVTGKFSLNLPYVSYAHFDIKPYFH